MSLYDLNKDELISLIRNLKEELEDLKWKYSYCDCEHEVGYCSQKGCNAKWIQGKNLHPKKENCETVYTCRKCRVPYRGGSTTLDYCDKHIKNHGETHDDYKISSGWKC